MGHRLQQAAEQLRAPSRRIASTSPGSTPPPWAKSGRPPPRRPSCFISSGALSVPSSDGETAAMTLTPSSAIEAETSAKRRSLFRLRNSSTTAAWALRSRPSKRGVQTSVARHLARGPRRRERPAPPWRASSAAPGSRARGPSAARAGARTRRPARAGPPSPPARAPRGSPGRPGRAPIAASPARASTRRVPAEMPCSAVTRKRPISPVWPTWVPPQNSLEKPGTSTTRTRSPYLSPKNASAP